jgi:5-methylcytosine-specific restriction endonuclease McrA
MNKIITVDIASPTETADPPKAPKKRVITTTREWTGIENDLGQEQQWTYIKQLYNNRITDIEQCSMITRQIKNKISAYRSQDTQKKLLNVIELADVRTAIELLYVAENKCFYCKSPVRILYENVRDPRQWSLDRIDNALGHIKNNLMIACLECNLRRRTMYHERYAYTKQMVIIKKDSSS